MNLEFTWLHFRVKKFQVEFFINTKLGLPSLMF